METNGVCHLITISVPAGGWIPENQDHPTSPILSVSEYQSVWSMFGRGGESDESEESGGEEKASENEEITTFSADQLSATCYHKADSKLIFRFLEYLTVFSLLCILFSILLFVAVSLTAGLLCPFDPAHGGFACCIIRMGGGTASTGVSPNDEKELTVPANNWNQPFIE